MQNFFENMDEDRREVDQLNEIIRWKSESWKSKKVKSQTKKIRKKNNSWGKKYDPHVKAAINSLQRGTFIKHLI
jgi:hypothetical protein